MNIILIYFLTVTSLVNARQTSSTMALNDRILFLKSNITMQIGKRIKPIGREDQELAGNYEYVDSSKRKITPISDNDPRRISQRYKLPELLTTDTAVEHVEYLRNRVKPRRKKHGWPMTKKMKVFFRRYYHEFNAELKDLDLEPPAHCRTLITPTLKNIKANQTRITYKHYTIQRLIQLLKTNASESGHDEVMSIMYQISDIPIRLFQWDIGAIAILLNVICHDKIHTIMCLKTGLTRLFKSWNVDLMDTVSLVQESKIFRPPCYQKHSGGSTKNPRRTTYKKPNTTYRYGEHDNCT